MAKIICDLYVNYSKLKNMSNSGKVLIEKYFSFNKGKEIILKDINIKSSNNIKIYIWIKNCKSFILFNYI